MTRQESFDRFYEKYIDFSVETIDLNNDDIVSYLFYFIDRLEAKSNLQSLELKEYILNYLVSIENYLKPYNITMKSIVSLVKKKNQDYGGSFDITVDKWGLMSALQRLYDKASRIQSLSKNSPLIDSESSIDSLVDYVGYSILLYTYIDLIDLKITEGIEGITVYKRVSFNEIKNLETDEILKIKLLA